MPLQRTVAIGGVILGLIGLALKFIALVAAPAEGVTGGFAAFILNASVLTAIFAVLIWVADLAGTMSFLRSPVVRLMTASASLLVMLLQHLFLNHVEHNTGAGQAAVVLLTYVVPALYVGYWLVYAPRGTLNMGHALLTLVGPAIYLIVVWLVGSSSGVYPYAALNPAGDGANVVNTVAGLGLTFLVISGVAVFIDQYAAKAAARHDHHAAA